jgi:hypothetical protein
MKKGGINDLLFLWEEQIRKEEKQPKSEQPEGNTRMNLENVE